MKFNPDQDIPDLTGKVIIVTGGTDGLGKQSVLQLSKHNPTKIYLAARSPSKAEAAISQIRELNTTSSTCPIEFLQLDLTSFASIKSAAESFLSQEKRLDILLANAGIVGSKGVTNEGYEMTMGVNHLGHALFIRLLLPQLIQTAQLPGSTPGSTRVVILGSEAESFAKNPYPYTTLSTPQNNLYIMTKYGQSKLANLHYTKQLVEHFPEAESGVRFICVHPGGVNTNIGHDILKDWPVVKGMLKKVINVVLRMVSVEEGALNQLWACTESEAVNGEFYWPVAVTGKGSKMSNDQEMAKGLWDWTEGILGPELEGVKA